MHAWYAKLIATGFPGKLLVMYVHDPSLMLVLTRGKTIKGTMPEFCSRLEALLHRSHFKDSIIDKEIPLLGEGYVVSKTSSKSMLGRMNGITENLEISCMRYRSYDTIDTAHIEDIYMEWLTHDPSKPGGFRCTIDFWKDIDALKE